MFFRRRFRGQKGFTLIELLAVIAILAVLILIAVPIISANIQEAKKTTCESNIKMLNSAIQRYYFDNGSYPGDLSALVPKYIDEMPECPLANDGDDNNDYDANYDKTNGKVNPHNHQ